MLADARQFDLFSVYPEIPGARPTDTSMAAADSVADQVETVRDAVLAEIRRRGGATADEVADALERTVLTVRPRVSELRRLGRVRGLRRPAPQRQRPPGHRLDRP